IRLIKDGYRVAMLSSVRTIHSHNRSAGYYLKRSFVDVIFLVGLFDDFRYPTIESPRGLVAGIVSTAAHLAEYLAAPGDDPGGSGAAALAEWSHNFRHVRAPAACRLGDAQLDNYIDGLVTRFLEPNAALGKADFEEAHRFVDAFIARLKHFNDFADSIYSQHDAEVRQQLREGMRKVFAATVGSTLGF